MGKKKLNKRPINHTQKAIIPKNMWNSKTLKIQRTF
jgi:hypothetical protein